MVKEFNSPEEIKKYYVEKTNKYVFKENGEYIDLVAFNFGLNVEANIEALDIIAKDINAIDIKARNITANRVNANDLTVFAKIHTGDIKSANINADRINAKDIEACDIRANDIEAENISYYAVCFAYGSIKCKSIKGRFPKAKHFVLIGTLEAEND